MIIEFDGDVFRWDARDDASWFFTAVPPELSDDIREIPRPYRGFGAVRVRARIGGTRVDDVDLSARRRPTRTCSR